MLVGHGLSVFPPALTASTEETLGVVNYGIGSAARGIGVVSQLDIVEVI